MVRVSPEPETPFPRCGPRFAWALAATSGWLVCADRKILLAVPVNKERVRRLFTDERRLVLATFVHVAVDAWDECVGPFASRKRVLIFHVVLDYEDDTRFLC